MLMITLIKMLAIEHNLSLSKNNKPINLFDYIYIYV